jgi:hypothetical protein
VLCAVDENSQVTVKLAAQLARAMGAELTILTVNVGKGGTSGVTTYVWNDAQLETLLKSAVAEAKDADTPGASAQANDRSLSGEAIEGAPEVSPEKQPRD